MRLRITRIHLDRPLRGLAALVVRLELLLGGGGANVAPCQAI